MPLPDQPRPEATESKFASGSASPSATQVQPALRRRQRVRGVARPAVGGDWGLRRIFLKLGHRAGPTVSHSIWNAHADNGPRWRSCRSRSGLASQLPHGVSVKGGCYLPSSQHSARSGAVGTPSRLSLVANELPLASREPLCRDRMASKARRGS